MKMTQKLDIKWEDEDGSFEEEFGEEENTSESSEFRELLTKEQVKAPSSVRPGHKVKAVVTFISESDDIFLEFGSKQTATMQKSELCNEDGELLCKVGDTVEAFIVSHKDGEILLSNSMSHKVAKENALETSYANKIPVKGKIVKVNKGGVEVQLLGRRGFCPASKLELFFVEDLASYEGREFEFMIESFDRRNMVVSRVAVLQLKGKDLLEKLKKEKELSAEEKTLFKGTVQSIRPYGAMVDLGGIIGMVHVSELSFGHVHNPEDIVKLGDTVNVCVLDIEEFQGKQPKISLSMKAAQSDPWDSILERYKESASYSGKVVRLENFGAFIVLEPGIEGLIHVSEMCWTKRVHHPKEIVKVGDLIEVRILQIDTLKKRISLSMKSIEEDPWFHAEEKFSLGKKIKGTVLELKAFGAIVELEEGVSGLLPISILKKAFGDSFRKNATPKNVLEVIISHVDIENHRIGLTLDSIEEDSSDNEDYKRYVEQERKSDAAKNATKEEKIGTFGEIFKSFMKD